MIHTDRKILWKEKEEKREEVGEVRRKRTATLTS